MQKYLIKDIQVVNEGQILTKDVLIRNGRIEKIADQISEAHATEIIGTGKFLLPGLIDDQVHFREPGLTHKANIASESRAAVAGGVTSFMEMPNTVPNALTLELLEDKYSIASLTSLANYSFFMGAANDNIEEILKVNTRKKDICGVKIFMGSSTGNMLVDNYITLDKIFRDSEVLIATHCEDEKIIRENYQHRKKEKELLDAADHPIIRNDVACFESSLAAIQFAKKHNSRLHILHISTAIELALFSNMLPLKEKRITSEVCVHHLHFTADDYATHGYQIKCNPAIKAATNKAALWEALLDDRLDVIATDHAPHTLQEKGLYRNEAGILCRIEQPETVTYEHAHAGLPLVQHSLQIMLQYVDEGRITLEKVVQKTSHAVADCFGIQERGYIREGYYADLVIVDRHKATTITPENIGYKCGWSPLENTTMNNVITHTFVNGHLVYHAADGNYGNAVWNESNRGARLSFDR